MPVENDTLAFPFSGALACQEMLCDCSILPPSFRLVYLARTHRFAMQIAQVTVT